MDKTTYFSPNKTLRLGDKLLDLSTPAIMGILNVTPDSFFDGGNYSKIDAALKQTETMLKAGAAIIDIGGMSTKPGAEIISPEEELQRVLPVLDALKKVFGDIALSIDTVHSLVAKQAIEHGAVMINDVSAGKIDENIIQIAAEYQVPYVLMHMLGNPATMQQSPEYDNVVEEVFDFFKEKTEELRKTGVNQCIIDPGFGFGKTVKHNYLLAQNLDVFHKIGLPIMVGISRKSVICKVLHVNPENALNGTTALHALLLLKGANILRVHDVAEAREVIQIVGEFNAASD